MTTDSSLKDRRILVVEDEYFIASDLRRILLDCDAVVLGPVGNLAGGLVLAERERVDAAILDINLDGDMSYELARRLSARQIPHIFVTGYDEWSVPEPFRATPRVTKPFTSSAIVDLVSSLCSKENQP